MCGIAGIIRTDGQAVPRETLARMAAALVHRGPDQEGFWLDPADPRAGLAVRRLAVIDPEGSRQPMANPGRTAWLAYNGEIFNYRDLRAALAARGHQFRSAGDTEAVIRLYDERGPEMLRQLVGMFAFAIWDAPKRRLFLARDRLGQKPLYWWHGRGAFVFASELAALFECPEVPRVVDRRALGDFLRFGYVPAPATGFAGIYKLTPAHYLLFDAAAAKVDGPWRYWDIPREPPEQGVAPEEWGERALGALSEAVRSQLVADVPLGVLLSGGLDSSTIAALASEHVRQPLRTFTVSFETAGFDEAGYAREVADFLGTEHAVVRVQPRCVEALETLVRHHGEPFADPSGIAMYHLAEEARRQVVVALSGDGGDESFGGYPRHAALWLSERMPAFARSLLAPFGRRIRPRPERKSRWNELRRFLLPLALDPLPRYLAWRSLFAPEDLVAPPDSADPVTLLAPEFAADAFARDPLGRWREAVRGLAARPVVDQAMAIDLQDYLPNDSARRSTSRRCGTASRSGHRCSTTAWWSSRGGCRST